MQVVAEAEVETKAQAMGHHSDNHAAQNCCHQYSVLTGVDGSEYNVYIVVSESVMTVLPGHGYES